MAFTFTTQSSWNRRKFVHAFGFATRTAGHSGADNEEENIRMSNSDSCSKEQDDSVMSSTRSFEIFRDKSHVPPLLKQKRSFADITMKLTEQAEEMFLFGTQDYHERRPTKRQRLIQRMESWEEQQDYELSTKAVVDMARQASS